jgi:uncharacterized protein YjbI with pentapeptide repeats
VEADGATLSDAMLLGCDLSGANLAGGTLEGTTLVDAKLVGDVRITTQIPNPKNRNEGDWVLDYRELLTGLAGKERR